MEFESKIARMEELREENSTQIYQPVPDTLTAVINKFKEAYQDRHGRLPVGGKKSIIILMLIHGQKGLEKETELLNAGVIQD